MGISRVEALSQDPEIATSECRIEGLYWAADARLEKQCHGNTRSRRREDGSPPGLAVLLLMSLWLWPCSAFSPRWSAGGGSSLLGNPLQQSQPPVKWRSRWPGSAAGVQHRGDLLGSATSGIPV